MNIIMVLLDDPVEGKCEISGKKVVFDKGVGFFIKGNLKKPVDPSTALKEGFSMDKKTWEKISLLIDEGARYEEVQKSAHREFDDL
ncbi:MAG: hypothetical protein JW904_02270 [Spirochaetales bacterium]|nr:hypothetical protein [Spirochaetales bacterium]